MGDPKAMAFGRIAMGIMEKSGLKKDIQKNIVVYGATVKQLALYVAQGDVDAAIIGRADAFQFPKRIRIVTIPPAYFDPITVAAAVLKSSKHVDLARTFSDYVRSKPSVDVYIRFGFLPLQEVSR
jgi:molybdate transport system substrate-binding protein